MKLISAASAVLLAYLVWGSRGWPLIHDAPLMHYIAWLIGQGAVPYRDAFDMNLPGVYLLHLAVLRVGGAGDLGLAALRPGLARRDVRPAPRVLPSRSATAGPPVSAALLFALYHLSGGAWHAGQRDFLLCLFLLLGGLGRGAGAPSRLHPRRSAGAGSRSGRP